MLFQVVEIAPVLMYPLLHDLFARNLHERRIERREEGLGVERPESGRDGTARHVERVIDRPGVRIKIAETLEHALLQLVGGHVARGEDRVQRVVHAPVLVQQPPFAFKMLIDARAGERG